MGCTKDELARYYGCSTRTIERDPNAADPLTRLLPPWALRQRALRQRAAEAARQALAPQPWIGTPYRPRQWHWPWASNHAVTPGYNPPNANVDDSGPTAGNAASRSQQPPETAPIRPP